MICVDLQHSFHGDPVYCATVTEGGGIVDGDYKPDPWAAAADAVAWFRSYTWGEFFASTLDPEYRAQWAGTDAPHEPAQGLLFGAAT